jgi:hypothetical protein
MKNPIIILAFLLFTLQGVNAQNVTQLEYFIDNSDPGFGQATQVAISSGTLINESFNVSLAAVSTGLHSLNIRVKGTGNVWSLTHTVPFYTVSTQLADVMKLEYFVDTDPGFGLGQQVAITTDSMISKSFTVNTSALSTGIHVLNVRVQDTNGSWSLAHAVPFYVVSPMSADITALEYFFDTDPGYGSGSSVAITPGATINESFPISTASLSTGIHVLNVRTRDTAGQWSFTHTVPFINIATGLANITTMEYFFDSDPGFGAATSVAITPGTNLTQSFVADVSGLSTGIHSVSMRTRDASGVWSLTHSVPFIVVATALPNVTRAEYFFDSDPGFGAGTSLAIAPSSNVTQTFIADVSGLSTGMHTFHMRTMDASGSWSLTHTVPFITVSTALPDITRIEYFFDTDPGYGAATQVSITPGTSLANSFVADISGLTGGLHTLQMRARDGSGNWSHVHASSFIVIKEQPDIVALEYAIDNDPGVGSGTTIQVAPSMSIEQNIAIPMDTLAEGIHTLFFRAKDSNGSWGITQIITVDVCNTEPALGSASEVTTNSFRVSWQPVAAATAYHLDVSADNFASFVPGYEDRLVNDTTDVVTGLLADVNYQFRMRTMGSCLSVNSDTLSVLTYQKTDPLDSLVLTQLYSGTDGATWNFKTNWLTRPAASWYGITVDQSRVRSIILPANGLKGALPAGLSDLDSLSFLDVSGNALNSVPDLSNVIALNDLNIGGNLLTFEDIEPNVGITNFVYTPQAPVGEPDTLVFVEGDTIVVGYNIGGSANQYQWQIDGAPVGGQTSNNLIRIATLDDNGLWTLKTTNTIATELELMTQPLTIIVEQLGITSDSLALVSLYNSTNGASWTNKTNWLTGNVSTWFGITTANDNVTAIELSNNNLQGIPHDSLANLRKVATINLSGNKLTALPDLTGLDSLTALNVSGNKLHFESLERNIGIPNFSYANQAPIGVPDSVYVRVKVPHEMTAVVGGANNLYQWTFDGVPIPDATSASHQITEANRSDMGVYTCEITNSIVPGLTLATAPLTVFVVADMSGILYADQGQVAQNGTVTLFKITSEGGYDTISVQDVTNTGSYMFENIILSEYQIMGYANKGLYARALPTYYTNTIYWEEADTVFLEDHTTNLDIVTQLSPLAQPAGQGVINGFVVDIDNHSHDGRIHAPKRVANAAVSARRVENSGRGKEEILTLVTYGFTDENGEFEFANLDNAEYRMNVQYPGILMDVNSEIDITVGSALEQEKRIEAKVEGGKIAVRVLIITGIWSREDYPADIYPNPASTTARIKFKGPSPDRNIQISDISSRTLLQQSANETEVTLDLSALAVGMYMLNIEENGTKVKTVRLEIH